MKTKILLIASCFILSFSFAQDTLKPNGTVMVVNANDSLISIPYFIPNEYNSSENYNKIVKLMNAKDFQNMVYVADANAKWSCKFPFTYTAKDITMALKNDTIRIVVRYDAKNADGVIEEDVTSSKYIGTRYIGSGFIRKR